ncbi:MAG: adenylyltransferase/cytidyltransferase family protein [Candidatus Andersenbacteria bacterium]
MSRVLVFGTFDPLHEGHHNFFNQAKAEGTHLTVVVARDSQVRVQKGREPHQPERERLQAVARASAVDQVLLGEEGEQSYALLGRLAFEVLAVGYDQEPDDAEIQEQLRACGKQAVRLVRLKPYQPDIYKSSYLRSK